MALQLLAANNAQSVLAAGISASATTLTLNTGTGSLFPSPAAGTSFFKLTIIDAATGTLTEIVHVTARNGDVFTIQRGQEGTVPRAWSANDIVANMMTAGTLSYILGNFQPLDPTLTALAALVGVANKLPYFNGDDTAALTDLTQVGRDIIGKNTTADVISYLGLGELVLAGTMTGALVSTGYLKFPAIIDGVKRTAIAQWGLATGTTGKIAATYATAFPNAVLQIICSVADKSAGSGAVTLAVNQADITSVASRTTVTITPSSSDFTGTTTARFISIGY
ncbi:hypothetical protein [Citrobacter sp. wls716]|uniref:gp53-like domain-containing protein n=1 Tax=Citrobacter sp. wls716 TaxID=2576420 RepID=UPI00207B7F27|nr:hypothetical protein [Citrobacter sp. wls716]